MTDKSSVDKKHKSVYLFAIMLSMAYLYGVLSPQHYAPSTLDLYIGLGISLILSIGLLISVSYLKLIYISYTGMICFFFASLIACQPLLSAIDYSDSLLFPMNSFVLMGCLSVTIANIKDKSAIVSTILASLYVGGILIVFTQILQLLSLPYPSWLRHLLFYGSVNSRPYGNIGQPNQAAYVIAMAIMTSGYWFFRLKHTNQLAHRLLIVWLLSSIVFLAIGQGLTSSRGGLVLSMTACLGIVFLNSSSIKIRFQFSVLIISVFAFGNWLGAKLLLQYSGFQQTALDRMVSTDVSRPLRWYLQEQAWLTFSTDWLTGAGWGNLPKVALAHAEHLNRFEFATNTHFLPSQIAAELGLLGIFGLLAIVFVVWKEVGRANHSIENKTLAVVIVISLLYACSEYPFWYMRFLFLFTCLIALIDETRIKVNFNLKPALIGYLVLLLVGSSFYIKSYRQYVAVDSLIKRTDVEAFEAQVLVENLSDIYGFSKFREVMMFKVLSMDNSNLKLSVLLGNRVVANYLDPELMKKQAIFLALDNQKEESLRFYKAACLYKFSQNCDQVAADLQTLSDHHTNIFFDINNEFKIWRNNSL